VTQLAAVKCTPMVLLKVSNMFNLHLNFKTKSQLCSQT